MKNSSYDILKFLVPGFWIMPFIIITDYGIWEWQFWAMFIGVMAFYEADKWLERKHRREVASTQNTRHHRLGY